MSALHEYEPDKRIELDGSERGCHRGTAMFLAKNETTLSAMTQDVVEVALPMRPSNKLGINQSNGSILLE
jgi:hypothetical protein